MVYNTVYRLVYSYIQICIEHSMYTLNRADAGEVSRASRRRLQLWALFGAQLAQHRRRGGGAPSARAVRAAHTDARSAGTDRRHRALPAAAWRRGDWSARVFRGRPEHVDECAHAAHAGSGARDWRRARGQRAVRRRLVPRERLSRAASLWLLVGSERESGCRPPAEYCRRQRSRRRHERRHCEKCWWAAYSPSRKLAHQSSLNLRRTTSSNNRKKHSDDCFTILVWRLLTHQTF